VYFREYQLKAQPFQDIAMSVLPTILIFCAFEFDNERVQSD